MRNQADEGSGGRVARLPDQKPNYTDLAGSEWIVRPLLVSEPGKRVKRLRLVTPGPHDTERRQMTDAEAWADWTDEDEDRAEAEFYGAADDAADVLRDARNVPTFFA